MLLQRGDSPGAQIRDRADVEHDPPVGYLAQQPGILVDADAVPDPVGAELLERAPHRPRPGDFAGVRDRCEPELARELEGGLVRLGRKLGLEASEPDADDSAAPVPGRPADALLSFVERVTADYVGRQPHLDAVQLARLLGAVAVAVETHHPPDAAPHSSC